MSENNLPLNEDTQPLLDEALLIKKLRARDESAFQELINGFGPRLFKTARLLTGSHQAAEELVADTLTNAFMGINKFKQKSSLFNWLHRILLNRFYYQIRPHKKEVRFDGSVRSLARAMAGPDPDQETLAVFRQQLPVLLRRLSREHQEIILLKYLEEMKVRDIAAHLGITESAVKMRLQRALIIFRNLLKDSDLFP